MPQVQLPLFPEGVTHICPEIAFECKEGQIVYINGHLPVFTHDKGDLQSFRLFSSQLIVNGVATQGQISKAFGIPLTTIKRYTKVFRQGGAKAFFVPRKARRGRRLNPEKLKEAQDLLDQGIEVPEISEQLGVLATTLHKAIQSGRLKRDKKKERMRRPQL
ncbi:MAG: helix-turn-helix domain-containing protein [Nitrospinaceae bacterium]|nr:helix-turn-helix domain-containing protein [Nitrospinaceae bacterium]